MINRYFFTIQFILILAMAAAPVDAFSQTKANARVVILPYEVYSEKDQDYLRTRIPEVLKTHLENEGAEIPEIEIPKGHPIEAAVKKSDIGTIREFGSDKQADYVIWGSITWLSGGFSLNSKLLTVNETGPPEIFYEEGDAVEALSSSVKALADKLILRIFKWESVAEVAVEGNRRIEDDAVTRVIRTKPGMRFSRNVISQDLKAVYNMGYFDDIRIESEDLPGGKRIVFHVKEKPTIRKISVKGARAIEEPKILENLTIKTGSILNVFEIYKNMKQIELLYKEKNYHNVQVSYDIIDLDHNQADLEFIVSEGEKLMIKSITFLGNKSFSTEELQDLMKTKEKNFMSWLTSRGELKRDQLEQDVAVIRSHYLNNGYMEVKISDPLIEMEDKWIHVTIKIEENRRYKIRKVDVAGDMIISRDKLFEKLKIPKKEFYDHDARRRDIMTIQDLYSDEGYAFVNVSTDLDQDEQAGVVDIVYHIDKGKQVYFERIIIGGNTITRDKVIRRQLHVYEQELYSSQKIQRSLRNLHRLDYFEEIRHNIYKGSADDKMVLKIDVKEKSTGMFTFGGGYSSVNKLFMQASVTQRNLFGRGQILSLKAEIGGTSNIYQLSFTEPWLFDIPLSAGVDLHNWVSDYDTYDKDRKGGGVRLGYRIFDYTNIYLRYIYDIVTLEKIEEDASQLVKDMAGENVTSSISMSLSYDSRDRIFNPTEGADHRFTVEYAGIGGDVGFTKYTVSSGYYIPLLKALEDAVPEHISGIVGFLHGEGGYAQENAGGILPDYERFYLGGMNSLRGFDWRDIHCFDDDGAEIGGDKYVQFNAEILFPLLPDVGVVGVLFYDTGNVYNNNEALDMADLRQTAGFGFRWYSPMGPIRIESGYILDRKEGENRGGKWDFTMGTAF